MVSLCSNKIKIDKNRPLQLTMGHIEEEAQRHKEQKQFRQEENGG